MCSITVNERNDLLMVNSKVLIQYFNNNEYTIGETEEGCYVYKKSTNQLYTLTVDSMTKLLLKLETLIKYE